MSIKLARIISDGMVIQRGKDIVIRGFSEPGNRINAKFVMSTNYGIMMIDENSDNNMDSSNVEEIMSTTITKENGEFMLTFPAMQAGGPYSICVYDDTEQRIVNDIYIGDVFVLEGQSNIEFPMIRVKDTYPEAFENPNMPLVRTFKIVENRVFDGPIADNTTGEWIGVNAESINTYSAIGHFLGKHLQKKTGVAVGLINTSLGGSPIETWMSEEMLEVSPSALEELKLYKDPEYVESVLKRNDDIAAWYSMVDNADKGFAEGWNKLTEVDDSWKTISLPVLFKDVEELAGMCGTVWFTRKFTATEAMANQDAMIWFGTIMDNDIAYVNGVKVGNTEYCYPPRRYKIPKGVLKAGENTITFRIRVDKGHGEVTPGKLLAIFTGSGRRITDGYTEGIEGVDNLVDISGEWKYKVGCRVEPIEEAVFVSWKPTALFNGMLSPVTNYPIHGIVWYQGESNADDSEHYYELFEKMVMGYRKLWKDDIPVYFLQLPKFKGVEYVQPELPSKVDCWDDMQKVQAECLKVPNTYMIVAKEWGEDNDLHPQRKEPLGEMLAEMIYNNI